MKKRLTEAESVDLTPLMCVFVFVGVFLSVYFPSLFLNTPHQLFAVYLKPVNVCDKLKLDQTLCL